MSLVINGKTIPTTKAFYTNGKPVHKVIANGKVVWEYKTTTPPAWDNKPWSHDYHAQAPTSKILSITWAGHPEAQFPLIGSPSAQTGKIYADSNYEYKIGKKTSASIASYQVSRRST